MIATSIGTTVDKRIYVIRVIEIIIRARATWFGSVKWDSYHSLKNLNIDNSTTKIICLIYNNHIHVKLKW